MKRRSFSVIPVLLVFLFASVAQAANTARSASCWKTVLDKSTSSIASLSVVTFDVVDDQSGCGVSSSLTVYASISSGSGLEETKTAIYSNYEFDTCENKLLVNESGDIKITPSGSDVFTWTPDHARLIGNIPVTNGNGTSKGVVQVDLKWENTSRNPRVMRYTSEISDLDVKEQSRDESYTSSRTAKVWGNIGDKGIDSLDGYISWFKSAGLRSTWNCPGKG